MDFSSLINTLLSSDGAAAVSKNTNTALPDVAKVIQEAAPMLLKGIDSQAKNPAAAASVTKALAAHGANDTSDIASFLTNANTADGAKIVDHLLGSDKTQVVNDIAKKSGVDTSQVMSMLANYAPLIMSLVGQNTAAAKTTSAAPAGSSDTTTQIIDFAGKMLGEFFKGK